MEGESEGLGAESIGVSFVLQGKQKINVKRWKIMSLFFPS